jgi:hypothetical protein
MVLLSYLGRYIAYCQIPPTFAMEVFFVGALNYVKKIICCVNLHINFSLFYFSRITNNWFFLATLAYNTTINRNSSLAKTSYIVGGLSCFGTNSFCAEESLSKERGGQGGGKTNPTSQECLWLLSPFLQFIWCCNVNDLIL